MEKMLYVEVPLFCLLLLYPSCWSAVTQVSEPNDPRWRMVSGMKAAREYASYQHAVAMQQLPLVSVSRDLETILQSICDMLLFSEIVEMVDNSSDYYTLFQLNTQESCNWFNYLIDNDANMSVGTNSGLPSSCSMDNVTSLHSYCFQMAVREQDQLKYLIHHNLYDPISDYYSGTVTGSSSSTWLETGSIPPSQQSSIAPYL